MRNINKFEAKCMWNSSRMKTSLYQTYVAWY